LERQRSKRRNDGWKACETPDAGYDPTTDRLTFTPGRKRALGWHTVRIKAVDGKNIAGTKSWNFRIVSG